MKTSYGQVKMLEYYNIYGTHSSITALKNPKRQISRIYCSKEQLEKHPLIKNFPHEITNATNLEQLAKTTSHQGIVVKAAKITQYTLNLEPEFKKIVILDQITDPQNFGAIIRSAVAFDFDAIIIPKDNSIEENGTVAKIASGALDLISIFQVTNLNRAIEELKNENFWIVGLDGNSNTQLYSMTKFDRIAAIIGSEHKGMRPLVKKNCDLIVKIPINKNIDSLNASNAAAIFFSEIARVNNLTL